MYTFSIESHITTNPTTNGSSDILPSYFSTRANAVTATCQLGRALHSAAPPHPSPCGRCPSPHAGCKPCMAGAHGPPHRRLEQPGRARSVNLITASMIDAAQSVSVTTDLAEACAFSWTEAKIT